MGLTLAYNTNGLTCHSLEDAARIMADLGYGGMALTPDVHHLNPLQRKEGDWEAFRSLLHELGLSVVIETGARFILDPMKKHYPSLMTPGLGEQRFDFLKQCVDMAELLGARVVSLHSGKGEAGLAREAAMENLAGFVDRLLDHAQAKQIDLALEPEPGMFMETLEHARALQARLSNPNLKLTLDVGHVHISEPLSIPETIRACASDLVNVHLDDARDSRHEHLPPGDGEIDFKPVMQTLAGLNRDLFLSVELSRHSHEAVHQAKRAFTFFQGMLAG